MSLRLKLLLPFLMLFVMTALILQFAWLPHYIHSEQQSWQQKEYEYLKLLGSTLITPLLSNDLASLHQTLDSTALQHPNWRTIILRDATGKRLYPLTLETAQHGSLHWLEYPITYQNQDIAVLRVSLNLGAVLEQKTRSIYLLGYTFLGLFLLISLLSVLLQDIWVHRPLQKLVNVAGRITHGDFSAPLPASTKDEIGQLARGFEHMQQALLAREKALADNAVRLEAILNNVLDGIVTIDDKGIIQSANRAVSSIFGYETKDLIGQNVKVLMPAPYHDAHDAYLHNYLQSKQKKIIGSGRQVLGRRHDGSVFPLDLAVSEFEIDGALHFSGVMQDISERVAADDKLRRTLEVQQAIFNSANVGIVMTDLQGLIQLCNPAAERILGAISYELVQRKNLLSFHDAEELAHYAAHLSQTSNQAIPPDFSTLSKQARQGSSDEREWTYRLADGRSLPVFVSLTAMHDNTEINGFLAMITDISERKKIDRMKSEFISMVSHELRTPLTSIRGSLGLISGGAAGELPPKAKQLVDIAGKNSERLVRLINDILDVEKIEAGKMAFDIKPLPLSDLITQTLSANQGYAEQFKVSLKFINHAPAVMVEADKDRLEQVLTNLISNACKFSPEGGEVSITLEKTPLWVSVTIADQGPGIPEEFRQRIFQKFAQADSSDSRQKGGTGLGLSITKAIIERLRGHIGFHSEVGQGTAFFFRLPEWQTPQLTEIEENSDTDAEVLICEDDPDVAMLLRLYLKEAGIAADVAGDVKTAREKLEANTYRAMTLDLNLPDENGLSFLHQLRSTPKYAHLPIIVVSANAKDGQQAVAGEVLDVIDWLPKPIDNTRLTRVIKDALKHRTYQEGEKAHILHVEDNEDIRHVVAELLGDNIELGSAANLQSARAYLKVHKVDLVLLDIGLPDGSGLELLPELREHTRSPVSVVIFSAQQVPEDVSRQVSAALIKSHTANETLREAVLNALSEHL